MAIEVINIGAAPNDGTGDPLRNAYWKCNNNFAYLNSFAQVTPPPTLVGSVGDFPGMYAYDSTYFYYCYANYDGSSQIWAQVSQSGNVSATQIVNGTSSVDILNPNSNVAVSINGTSNVAVFTISGIEANNISAAGNVSVTGILTTVGNANVRHIIPAANTTYDLGSPTRKFRSLYVGGSTIYIDTANITANSSTVRLSTGNGATMGLSGTGPSNSVLDISGNINTGNVFSSGKISAVGNIECSGYFVGTFLGNITGNFAVPGSTTQILYNTAGNADASTDLTWNNSTKVLYINGISSATGNVYGSNISATGNIQSGNIAVTGQISSAGNITGQYILGNGALLTGVTSYGNSNVAAYLPTYSGNLAGALVSVSGNVVGGNVVTGGLVTATGNITGGNIQATNHTGVTFSASGNVIGGNISSGGLITASGNITGLNVRSLGVLDVTGNIGGGNLITNGQITATGNIYGDYFFAHSVVTATGNVIGANILTAGLISATGNVSGGNLSITGNITGGNVLVSGSGQISTNGNVIGGYLRTATVITNIGNGGDAILNGGANGVGNIGNSSTYFNTVFATATTALYADLAECYAADAKYVPGTVLKFGGTHEVALSDHDMDVCVAGVVSTNPAYKMNAGLQASEVVEIALVGRVPCRVQGTIRKGQMLVSAGNGRARAELKPEIGSVIGKALQDHDGEEGIIEIVVGRL